MNYQEFKNQIQREGKPRKSKVTNSWGIYDAYKHIRKNRWYDIDRPLKEHEFYTIVRQVNKLLANELALGHSVTFPSKMGKLELRKFKTGAFITNGRLVITYPIDWEETMKLWYEDEQAKKDKTLLRNETPYIYRIRYDKWDATYENKLFYEFTLNKFIKIALKENINQGITDTLW